MDTDPTPSPISLKKSLLKEDNTLRFELNGVGAAFWRTNEYHFKNMQIVGDVTDLSGQEGQNTFTISNTEATRSRIEDADFAKEQMSMMKLQILQQTTVSSFSQANSAPQMVLSLFR